MHVYTTDVRFFFQHSDTAAKSTGRVSSSSRPSRYSSRTRPAPAWSARPKAPRGRWSAGRRRATGRPSGTRATWCAWTATARWCSRRSPSTGTRRTCIPPRTDAWPTAGPARSSRAPSTSEPVSTNRHGLNARTNRCPHRGTWVEYENDRKHARRLRPAHDGVNVRLSPGKRETQRRRVVARYDRSGRRHSQESGRRTNAVSREQDRR